MSKREQGFTLIELMIVVAIIAIIASIASILFASLAPSAARIIVSIASTFFALLASSAPRAIIAGRPPIDDGATGRPAAAEPP